MEPSNNSYAEPTMMRLSIILVTLFGLGCPPPHYVDIFNNSGEPLEIDARFNLEPGQSSKFKAWALFRRWEEADSTGARWPILRLKARDRCADYRFKTAKEDWFHRGGSVTAGLFVQIDPDLSIRIADPDDDRPIAAGKAQAAGWPLRPRTSSSPPEDDPTPALVTFFRTEGGGRKSVFIDDAEVARLPRKRHFTVRLPPGPKSINAESHGNDPISLDLVSGRHYYIRLYKKLWAVGEDVTVVDKAEAESALLECLPNPCEFIFDERIHRE